MGSSISVGLANLSEAIQQTSSLLQDKTKLRELWTRADENSNGFITLSEFKQVIDEADEDDSPIFVDFDNEKAIRRAYFSTCGGGKNDEWVERREFPALLRNVIYFDKLWNFFDDVDVDDDRKISFEEFKAGAAKMELKGVQAAEIGEHFRKIDSSQDDQVLFDEWVKYFAASFHPLADDLDSQVFEWKSKVSPRKMIQRRRPKKNADGRMVQPDPQADAAASERATKFKEVEASFKQLMGEKDEMRALWDSLDYKSTGKLSLAQVLKFFQQDPEFEVLSSEPALQRAYKQTSVKTGASEDETVQWREFPALLRNAIVFNRLWKLFDDVDVSEDRKIDFAEFCRGCSQLGLELDVAECEDAFDEIDSDENGSVLFDEFCVWVGKQSIPVE